MNRRVAKKGLTAVAWCAAIVALVSRAQGASPRIVAITGITATLLLGLRFAITLVDAARGRLAWTRLPFALLISAEGVLHALDVGGGRVEAAMIAGCEVALLGTAIVTTARALREPGDRALLEDRLTASLARFVPERMARIAALEVVILRFALTRGAATPRGPDVFGYATESPLRLLVLAYPLMLLVNEVAIQALIPTSMVLVRVIAAGLDVYAFVWLVGVYRSMVARPHGLESSTLRLHRGALGSAVLDLGAIEKATAVDNDGTSRFPGSPLRMDVGGPRRVLLTLRQPARCRGFLGTRFATRILVSADDPDALCAAIETASTGADPQPPAASTM